MNNEIRHVTWGFGNVWISLSTFSPIGLKETHPQTSNVFWTEKDKKTTAKSLLDMKKHKSWSNMKVVS